MLLLGYTSGALAAEVTVQISGTPYQGWPAYDVLADGEVVQSGVVTPSGNPLSLTVPEGTSRLSIRFTNDAAAPRGADGVKPEGQDRDLIIQSVAIDGIPRQLTEFAGKLAAIRSGELVLYGNTEVWIPIKPRVDPSEVSASVTHPNMIRNPLLATVAMALLGIPGLLLLVGGRGFWWSVIGGIMMLLLTFAIGVNAFLL